MKKQDPISGLRSAIPRPFMLGSNNNSTQPSIKKAIVGGVVLGLALGIPVADALDALTDRLNKR